MNKNKTHCIGAANAARGAAAELRFQEWLSASKVAHLYIEQSPLTMPTHLRGQFKRVDNLVGSPGVGILAFDRWPRPSTKAGRQGRRSRP